MAFDLRHTCRQRDPFGCIAAAIENVLRHYGIRAWTQERLLEEWQRWKGGPVTLDLNSPADFLPATELGKQFTFGFLSCSLSEARAILRERAQRHQPTVISCARPEGGAHMHIVTDYTHDTVTAFDPGDAMTHEWPATEFDSWMGDETRPVHMLFIDPAGSAQSE